MLAGLVEQRHRRHEDDRALAAAREQHAIGVAAHPEGIETLATCGWIREKQNPLVQGPPGVGKPHLAMHWE